MPARHIKLLVLKKTKKNVCFLGPGAVSAHFSLLKQKLELGLCQTEKWVSLQFHVEKKKRVVCLGRFFVVIEYTLTLVE